MSSSVLSTSKNTSTKGKYGLSEARRDVGDAAIPLYVLNVSSKRNKRLAGVVNIPITTDRGNSFCIVIPKTWIPIAIDQQVAKKDIIDSTNFLSMINKGIIEIVDPMLAEESLNTIDAIAEIDKIQQDQLRIAGLDDTFNPNEGYEDETPVDEPQSVSPIAMEALTREDISASERYSIIRNNTEMFDANTWKYIASNAKEQKLIEMASQFLKKSS